jgi:chromosome segregation ATPase
VENNVNESKDKLIRTFQNEVEKIRTEIDNLNIHAISKKDEIVQATRKEAEELRKRMELFEEKYVEMEKRLVQTAAEKIDAIDAEYSDIESRAAGLTERSKKEFASLEQRLVDMKSELRNYEEQTRVFSRTDEMIKKVDDSLMNFEKILEASREEARDLEKFFENIEQIKHIRKHLDREIRAYQAKKDRFADIEREVRGLAELVDLVQGRADEMQAQTSKIDSVNSRIGALTETYTDLERRIHELQEYDEIIARNLDSVNKTEIVMQSIDGKIKSFQKTLERSDKRVEKMTEHLNHVEENTLFLKTRESEIQEVKDKFNEIDGLSAHIEKRIDQIYAMFQKIETLRKEINDTDNRLQGMFNETDRKMKQFADFIQAVDSNPIAKQIKGEMAAVRNVNENMINTIRELSSKGWSSDEIAKKLRVEENSVRLIINTASL